MILKATFLIFSLHEDVSTSARKSPHSAFPLNCMLSMRIAYDAAGNGAATVSRRYERSRRRDQRSEFVDDEHFLTLSSPCFRMITRAEDKCYGSNRVGFVTTGRSRPGRKVASLVGGARPGNMVELRTRTPEAAVLKDIRQSDCYAACAALAK
jgi:hypothetical protein